MQGEQRDKYAFLKMRAPASYVAGLGRGASGFTTRSDIGPAREAAQEEGDAAAEGAKEIEPDQFQDPENETGLFAGTVYEADDEEADRIYESVDSQLAERRRVKREKREREEEAKFREERPTIQSQFADLKRGLADMTDHEWDNLPEVNNLTGRKRNKMEGKSYAVPDSILTTARDQNALESSLDAEQMATGLETPASGLKDFAEIGEARNTMLRIKLEQVSASSGGTDSVAGGSSTIDPKGYLSGLQSQVLKTDAEIGDIKRARALLQSLIKTNPKHAPGWVAAAWLENVAGKTVQARKIIEEGCEHCPLSEDVWIAASELNTNENAKIILGKAVQHLGRSVKIWMRAVDLEHTTKGKKNVLRKALEIIPESVRLWKETVKLEESPEDARVLLSRAVDVIPSSLELWLALARLETPERARQVINRARKALPLSHEVWIAAARLQEEQTGDRAIVDPLIKNAVAKLRDVVSREQWLAEAERTETQGSPLTCQAIVQAALPLGVEEEDRLETWMEDASGMESKKLFVGARAAYAHALNVFPQKQSLWRKAAELEKAHGSRESLLELLKKAHAAVPQAEVLWLMAAKELWLGDDIPGARQILGDAFEANPESEGIWLAAIKLEAENGHIQAAHELMTRARRIAKTERIWIKSAVFERQHSTTDSALATVREGLAKFPTSEKLYMILGQLLLASNSTRSIADAREAFATGVKKCPHAVPLWIMSSQLEEKAGLRIKARALLEKARNANPKSEELWLESVKVEERDNSGAGKGMLARALQTLPTSGILHAHSVWSEPRPTRKSRSVDALKKTNNSPVIIVTVARLFWAERKIEKARDWFGRAVAANADYGDAWAWWYRFESTNGTEASETRAIVEAQCAAADPHHGSVWQSVSKAPANAGKSNKEVLLLAAQVVEESQ